MGKILNTNHGVFINGTSRPVFAVRGKNRILFGSTDSAGKAYGVTEQDVVDSANSTTKTITTHCGVVKFKWPTLASVQREWPSFHVVTPGQVQAKPCTIHFKTPGKHAKRYNVDVRSITATRKYLGISERQFDAIAHHLPGWQSHLPPCVVGISIHPQGSNPPANFTPGNARGGPYFELKQMANSIRVTPIPSKFGNFSHISEIPDFARLHGVWV